MGAVSNCRIGLELFWRLPAIASICQTIRRIMRTGPSCLEFGTVICSCFLITATLRGQPLFRAVVTLATIGLGFLVLFFVARMFSAGRGVKHHLRH